MCGTVGGANLTVMFFWRATLISLARLALRRGHLLQLVKLALNLTLTLILNAPGAPLPNSPRGKSHQHHAVQGSQKSQVSLENLGFIANTNKKLRTFVLGVWLGDCANTAQSERYFFALSSM